MITLLHGSNPNKLKELPDDSVDSIVTDPPYELGFMGKAWDSTGIAYSVELWRECLRVLKPGGHLLAFSGTRTYHRMAVAIEDAGFEVRDMIEWVYGSGFPKSLNIGKAVDKLQGNEREIKINPLTERTTDSDKIGQKKYSTHRLGEPICTSEPISDEAKQYEGWGTALKPAHEPICMARKPLDCKTVAENCLKWGTGGINVDGSRVGYASESDKDKALAGDAFKRKDTSDKGWSRPWMDDETKVAAVNAASKERAQAGRFPANLIHDNSDEVRACFPETKSGGAQRNPDKYKDAKLGKSTSMFGVKGMNSLHGDSGSASRFFKSIIYEAKASKEERIKGRRRQGGNNHPTVKPTGLMTYLIKMVTPLNGTVLDPFMGSGTTGVSAKQNGFSFIGIDQDADSVKIAQARIDVVRFAPTLF